MDDPELRSGEVISDALLQAIHESKTYIVVFSKNYASSGWCLDELVEILNCNKTIGRLVVPVFYNIEPWIVRHQRGNFKEAFEMHETRFFGEMEKLKNWRLALKEVANFSGKHISSNRPEADIIVEIVDEILLQINPKNLDVAKFPVGLDDRVKDITKLLSSVTEGVTRSGLYGMGGMGKTTLAKALYNQLLLEGSFKGTSFLANVREVSVTPKGPVSLQQQIIDDILKRKKVVEVHNVEERTTFIRERICSAKILVLIDDIDSIEQYESLAGPFASGSVVVITTRDEEILERIKVHPEYRYRVNELNDPESWTLFTQYAFENSVPDNNLMLLSKEVLVLAAGHPLALKVFGSHLSSKKSEVGWKSYIETLQKHPNSTVEQKILCSLAALDLDDPMLKKIFLDIACFFIGWKKKKVAIIMDTFYSFAADKMDTLKKKCLLTINDGDELEMHDLLRDTGRKVARNNAPDEPGKYSRLWEAQDVHDVLEKHTGTEGIEGIILRHSSCHSPLEGAAFERMSKLRFLYLSRIMNLTGNLKQKFDELRWLSLEWCPLNCLPSDFHPHKLVILELPCSKMRTLCYENKVYHIFEKLKTLNMSSSRNLTTTPNFAMLPCLETLDLNGCTGLKQVHMSVGRLVRLVSLNLHDCVNLRSLPDTFCNLRALEILNIGHCSSLEALPIELGNIESLKELNADGLRVSKLPDSIGRLGKLVVLRIGCNKNIKTLPNTICNLRTLEVLSVNDCCSLEEMPVELGNIESLKELNAGGLNVLKLPDSSGRLGKLVKLSLGSNKNIKTLPNMICNLRVLEVLSTNGCCSMEALPIELGNIESLKELDASELSVSKLPDSIGCLGKLVKLRFSSNKKLVSLPNTICDLISLEVLDISGCGKLEILPDQLWKLTRLRELMMNHCTMIKKLPDINSSQRGLLLQSLRLSSSGITALPLGFSQLLNLESLILDNCEHLLSIPELPPNLKWIIADGCKSLERLPNLSNLKRVENLDLADCSSLKEIQGLAEITSLSEIDLTDCSYSLFSNALTNRLAQNYSKLGRTVFIYGCPSATRWIGQSPDWEPGCESTDHGTGGKMISLASSSEVVAIILYCDYIMIDFHYENIEFSVKNSRSDYVWSRSFMPSSTGQDSCVVIIPVSLFYDRHDDGIFTISCLTDQKYERLFAIHLLRKTEIATIKEYDGTTVIVEDESS